MAKTTLAVFSRYIHHRYRYPKNIGSGRSGLRYFVSPLATIKVPASQVQLRKKAKYPLRAVQQQPYLPLYGLRHTADLEHDPPLAHLIRLRQRRPSFVQAPQLLLLRPRLIHQPRRDGRRPHYDVQPRKLLDVVPFQQPAQQTIRGVREVAVASGLRVDLLPHLARQAAQHLVRCARAAPVWDVAAQRDEPLRVDLRYAAGEAELVDEEWVRTDALLGAAPEHPAHGAAPISVSRHARPACEVPTGLDAHGIAIGADDLVVGPAKRVPGQLGPLAATVHAGYGEANLLDREQVLEVVVVVVGRLRR
ncbi:hypothetical protein B0I35DRAFT_160562 [Stachybotrys elegans]|uniref:Uncharacterized protein n=1 Tax=Stachybotrys elegans TaxID=80388 RepID=A0A8K0SVA7_9HYPO|nr:hypothetical protein B0I35DRAFT_160562 [Stachybotrys elegans]